MSGLSEKVSILALGEYISGAGACSLRRRAINMGPPPSVSRAPPKGKEGKGITPKREQKGGRAATISNDPSLENPASAEVLFSTATAPEEGTKQLSAGQKDAPCWPLPVAVSHKILLLLLSRCRAGSRAS
jgi:hypothetical protein